MGQERAEWGSNRGGDRHIESGKEVGLAAMVSSES